MVFKRGTGGVSRKVGAAAFYTANPKRIGSATQILPRHGGGGGEAKPTEGGAQVDL